MTRPLLLGVTRAAEAEAACAAAPGLTAVIVGDLAALLLDDGGDAAGARARVAAAAQVAACVGALAPVARGRVAAEQAAAWTAARAEALGAALDRLDGCAEWIATLPAAEVGRVAGAGAVAEAHAAVGPTRAVETGAGRSCAAETGAGRSCAAETGAETGAGSGAAWLRARAAAVADAARAAADVARRAETRAETCAAALAGLARAVRVGPVAGDGGVDLAVLAPRDAGAALAARAPGLAFSGPWPAYSFVEIPA